MFTLNTILAHKKNEVEHLKQQYRYKDFEESPFFNLPGKSIRDLLLREFGIIAEIKRKSPSAGDLNPQLSVSEQGSLYEFAGAAAISCLTDHTFFGGQTEDLLELKISSGIPLLRKEFIIDEIQLFEAKAHGADAILLIAEALEKEQALHLTILAQSLGLEVLMEFHEKSQFHKINDLVDIIGINNRNLKEQRTDLRTSFELIELVDSDRVVISESGISTADEIEALKNAGFRGALIGESILRHPNPSGFIRSLTSSKIAS